MNHRTLGRLLGALFLCLAGIAAVLSAPASVAADDGDWRYGVIDSTDDPAAATRLGVSWTRVRFQWADVQPDGPDDWNPPVDDEALAAELDDGRMVAGLLIGIPNWARDRQRLPKGLYLPYDDPGNTWAAFVREAVGRYEGQIDHWIIWNEPDIDDPDAPGHTWDGDAEDFAQLLRVAYLVARETNPDAVIHLGAFTHFWDPAYFGRFLDILVADPQAAENNYYFDVATAHLYFQPDKIYDVITGFRADMTARGMWKPIWLVETNAPPADDSYWPVPNWTLYVTLYEQAAFIPQAMASALAAGAERIAVYKLIDVKGDRAANPEPFGLLRTDNSRRPAFDAYRVAVRQLSHAGQAVRERWDAVGQIRVDQGDQTTTVLFARLPEAQETAVIATAETAELVDMWGKSRTIEAENGVFTVDLQPALCTQTIADYCMIGGTVQYLVQEKGGHPLGALPLEDVVPLTPTAPDASATVAVAAGSEVEATVGATVTVTAATEIPVATGNAAAEIAATQTESDATAQPEEVAVQGTVVALATIKQATAVPAETAAGRPVSGLLLLGLGIVGALALGGWLLVSRRGH